MAVHYIEGMDQLAERFFHPESAPGVIFPEFRAGFPRESAFQIR